MCCFRKLSLIHLAEEEILIIFPTVDTFLRQEQAGFLQLLPDILKRKPNLMIRILTPIDERVNVLANRIKDQYQQILTSTILSNH